MRQFEYVRAEQVADALQAKSAPATRFIAGGTNLVDLLKYGVEQPARLVDITRVPALDRIEATEKGGLRIGALVTNARAAHDARIERDYPLLSSAILAGASPQLRNAATTGGNLMQRTRCYYFYDPSTPCNKRAPESGCGAIGGINRIHAILGASEHCIATHPSDMCVALAALDATVQVGSASGERSIPIGDFHRLPGDRPEVDTTLGTDEIILAVDLPAETFGTHYSYLKVRDRASYAFALVSVAAALRLDGGRITAARIALGGVAHKPWRVPEAEAVLLDTAPDADNFDRAASLLLRDARGQGSNDFKIDLARFTIRRALAQAAAGTPQSNTDKRIV
jgi:xanthine dehydrogenase YagS FAD-binding subunit